jgi:L-lactate dehydrogenase complex protein LldG
MNAARSELFNTIRRSLGVSGTEALRLAAVDDRLERAPKGVIPARGQVSGEARVALFKQQAEAKQATVVVVNAVDQVPEAIATYLRDHNLPATIRMGADPRLSKLPWKSTALDIAEGPSGGSDLNAVSHAFAGVAETGTLVMTSGADNPTTLNFLPDNHIVVLQAQDITGDYESMWQRLRRVFGKGAMPRTVNWITGPSRSADIEQTLLLGAHGPRQLHIVIVSG